MNEPVLELLAAFQSCRRLINVAPRAVRVPVAAAAGEVLLRACKAFGIRDVEIAQNPLQPSMTERIVWRRLGLETAPEVLRELGALSSSGIDAAIASVDAKDPRKAFTIRSLRTPRGADLLVYECGPRHAPPWLLVLPYGVPADLCFGLAQKISAHHRFVTFEGPELLHDVEHFDACAHGIDAYETDMLAVLDRLEIARTHVVGLCAGAIPALRFTADHGERVLSLVLGNGTFATTPTSAMDVTALCQHIGGNRKKARTFFELMAARDPSTIEPESTHLTLIPYSNPDRLYMFMTAFKSFYTPDLGSKLERWLQLIDQPVLVALGERDTIVPPHESRQVAEKLKHSRLLVDPEGTHLSLLRAPNPELLAAMLAFCRSAQDVRTH